MQISATEAKNRFGHFCAQAKIEPVIVEKDSRPDSVLVSYESYSAMRDSSQGRTLAQRKRLFYEQHKEWFDEQNRIVEEFGVFGEEHRPW